MKRADFLITLSDLIRDVKAGLLATIDGRGHPHMRWMAPAVLDERPGGLYAVASRAFIRREQLSEHPAVQWMVQSRSLDTIFFLDGRMDIVDNHQLLEEVLDIVGAGLHSGGEQRLATDRLVVLETVLIRGTLLQPAANIREHVEFE